MRRTRAKQIRKIAIMEVGKKTANKTYRKRTGQFMYPGNSVQGRYIQLKKRYLELFRKGKRPWLEFKKMEG